MKLTDNTFVNMIATLKKTYINWELPESSVDVWFNILTLAVSDELLPIIILNWVSNKSTAPKNPAEIIQHGRNMVKSEYDSADTESELIIESARNAYYATDDFLTFADMYSDSFAAALGTPAQEAYIKENLRKHSSNPQVLILVYDELKGEVKDCFTGDAEHGVEFLRTHIKKSWNAKLDDTAKAFLKSGNTDFIRLAGNDYELLEG